MENNLEVGHWVEITGKDGMHSIGKVTNIFVKDGEVGFYLDHLYYKKYSDRYTSKNSYRYKNNTISIIDEARARWRADNQTNPIKKNFGSNYSSSSGIGVQHRYKLSNGGQLDIWDYRQAICGKDMSYTISLDMSTKSDEFLDDLKVLLDKYGVKTN